jgi:hypothetical protein
MMTVFSLVAENAERFGFVSTYLDATGTYWQQHNDNCYDYKTYLSTDENPDDFHLTSLGPISPP